MTVQGFFFFCVFDGSIQDIRACQRASEKEVGAFCAQRARKPCEASSVYSSDKMGWPGHRLSSYEELSQK